MFDGGSQKQALFFGPFLPGNIVKNAADIFIFTIGDHLSPVLDPIDLSIFGFDPVFANIELIFCFKGLKIT